MTVGAGSRWLSPAMRLALGEAPVAEPGGVAWRTVETGFDAADLDASVNGRVVDRVRLVRINPAPQPMSNPTPEMLICRS